MLRTAFAERMEMSLIGGHGRLWCSEMMKCLLDSVPEYAERVKFLVTSRSLSSIERVDIETLLGVWGTRWKDCWQNLPEDLREASSDLVGYATYETWMCECRSQRAPYVAHDWNINPEYLADFMRIRLGSHWLSVV